MSWKAWQRDGRLEAHRPSKEEIAAQLRAASRALADANLPGISPEGGFQLAYDAALGLATIAVLASGHRVRARVGHHQLTLEAAGLALGKGAAASIGYLDLCRRKRNAISYDAREISEAEATELVEEASRFAALVSSWLRKNHPALS